MRHHTSFDAAGLAFALAVTLSTPGQLAAQDRRFTIDDLFDKTRKLNATGTVLKDLTWVDASHYAWAKPLDADTADWLKVEAVSGKTTPLYDASKLQIILRALPGIGEDEARKVSHPRTLVLNDDKTAAVFVVARDLFCYEFATARLTRLTSDPDDERDPTFSPDGRFVAFTRGHNLHVVEVATQRERALTTDGSAQVLNGRLDWVYQEEVYGRGKYRGFWWSPDSTRLAYLQLDERPVPEFTVVDHLPYRQRLEVVDYPKAGDPNPLVRLGLVTAVGGPTVWVDTSKYSGRDHLIVSVSWTPEGDRVVFQLQNREQTWLDLNVGDADTGTTRTVLHETTAAWVEPHDDPHWLNDGSFLWLSERDGWKHLYRYEPDGRLSARLTSGSWEVRSVHGVEEASGWVYFEATERSPIGSDVYRVRLDGTGLTRLSARAGTHTATFNPSFTYFVGTWSDVTTPTQTRLHRADGQEVRVIEENTIGALSDYRMATPELVQVKTRDGFVMEALLIKPLDFDPSRKYPVYQHTYGGPHAPQVRNAWGGTTYLYHQMLAQHGIAVWICDNRSASGKGAVSAWSAYKRLGETELADIEDGLSWLKQQPWVDESRIGINGWSYGGFMVSYALTHSKSFMMGIAGGSVTDWRDYDSIYTERYMLMPQNNPDGYERSAPRRGAANLHGRLLLVHGTMDDNVHMQNTIKFAHDLQAAGKPFELMLYPTERHGLSNGDLVKHMRTMMFDFVLRTLRPAAEDSPSSGSRDNP